MHDPPERLETIPFPKTTDELNKYQLVILLGGNTPDLHMALKDKFDVIKDSTCHFWGISAGAIVLTHLAACAVKNVDKYHNEEGENAAKYYKDTDEQGGPFFHDKIYVPHMNHNGSWTREGSIVYPDYEHLIDADKKIEKINMHNDDKPITVRKYKN